MRFGVSQGSRSSNPSRNPFVMYSIGASCINLITSSLDCHDLKHLSHILVNTKALYFLDLHKSFFVPFFCDLGDLIPVKPNK